MIVVTGATGHYGSAVVEGLLKKVPASSIGVSVRDPEKAAHLAVRGVRVTHGDFARLDTLTAAFDGAEQVLLVSANVLGDEVLRLHANAIQAAKAAGVHRILYTSHQAASTESRVAFASGHAKTEALLLRSGVPFVSLRNGFYAESMLYQLGGVQQTGKLALPADGPVSWTAREDLAQAAVAALTQPGLLDGITPPLTGTRTYTFNDVAELASDLLGRRVTRETVSDAAYQQAAVQRGFPEPMAAMLTAMFHAMRDGEFNVTDPTLERVLDRKPTDLRPTLATFFGNATEQRH